jgi:hypothetical protein
VAWPGRAVRADALLEPQAHLADLGVVDLDRGEVGALEPSPESSFTSSSISRPGTPPVTAGNVSRFQAAYSAVE